MCVLAEHSRDEFSRWFNDSGLDILLVQELGLGPVERGWSRIGKNFILKGFDRDGAKFVGIAVRSTIKDRIMRVHLNHKMIGIDVQLDGCCCRLISAHFPDGPNHVLFEARVAAFQSLCDTTWGNLRGRHILIAGLDANARLQSGNSDRPQHNDLIGPRASGSPGWKGACLSEMIHACQMVPCNTWENANQNDNT